MSNLVIKKNKYLDALYQEIDDELELAISQANSLQEAKEFNSIKTEGLVTKDIDKILDKTDETFKDKNVMLFGPIDGEAQNPEIFSYYLEGLRLRSLVDTVADFIANIEEVKKSETYQKMEMLFEDKDITVLALSIELAKLYAQAELDAFERNKEYILPEFKDIEEELKKEFEKILDTKSRKELVEAGYRIINLLADFFEELSELEFEWTDVEIGQANFYINLFATIEAHWYFLMLIREDEIVKLGLTNDGNVYHSTELYEGKQDMLDQAKAMEEAGVSYSSQVLKNHRK